MLASVRLARDATRNFRYDDALHDERRKPTVLDRTPRLARMAPLRNELHAATPPMLSASDLRVADAKAEASAAAAVQARSFAQDVRLRRAQFDVQRAARHREWQVCKAVLRCKSASRA